MTVDSVPVGTRHEIKVELARHKALHRDGRHPEDRRRGAGHGGDEADHRQAHVINVSPGRRRDLDRRQAAWARTADHHRHRHGVGEADRAAGSRTTTRTFRTSCGRTMARSGSIASSSIDRVSLVTYARSSARRSPARRLRLASPPATAMRGVGCDATSPMPAPGCRASSSTADRSRPAADEHLGHGLRAERHAAALRRRRLRARDAIRARCPTASRAITCDRRARTAARSPRRRPTRPATSRSTTCRRPPTSRS